MKSVLILGANSTIGRDLAEIYSKKGYNLILASRNPERLEGVKNNVEIQFDIKCNLLHFDAEDVTNHKNFWNQIETPPEISIILFGMLPNQEKATSDNKLLLETIFVNYLGAVSILNIISRAYKAKKEGIIIGVTSVAGLRGRSSNYIYGSAKSGLITYLSGLRNELYPYGVKVKTIIPGYMATKMTAELDLPKLLTMSSKAAALAIYKSTYKKSDVFYIKKIWLVIMLIIRLIPERVFKKMKL